LEKIRTIYGTRLISLFRARVNDPACTDSLGAMTYYLTNLIKSSTVRFACFIMCDKVDRLIGIIRGGFQIQFDGLPYIFDSLFTAVALTDTAGQ
jgi:hypothetical protein